MVANKKVINSKDLSLLFGLNSSIFKEFHQFLQKQKILQISDFEKRFSKWKSTFYNIYGTDTNEQLFLNHSYFVSLLIVILTLKFKSKFSKIEKSDIELKIKKYIYPETDLFFFPKISEELSIKINDLLANKDFEKEDLFQGIYQQIFLIITRHKIGEFYTPSQLVKRMLLRTYQIGLKTLDPSCGSGSFIIEIINTILSSNSSKIIKLNAIERVYGFDINPLATLTAKINIILLLMSEFGANFQIFQNLHIYNIDGLFPEDNKNRISQNFKDLQNSFDLIIGNPPWLTYKDLISKEYQIRVRSLSEELGIKPPSQYITHIELSAIFFYASAKRFLKLNGIIFFVITKSVLNGDHCYKFRAFKGFKDLEIWDFPDSYLFNVQHICLKANYSENESHIEIREKYPIKTNIISKDFEVTETQYYSSIKIEENGAKIILPENELKLLKNLSISPYKKKFFQGATLVPKSLIFFKVDQTINNQILISSDPEILKGAKKKWKFEIHSQKLESDFAFKTFLNKDMVPFYIKEFRNVFLPINKDLEYDVNILKENPYALKFYTKIDEFYQKNKKKTSKINDLFSNLNYWNKLTKQKDFKSYNVVYNASGSNLKAAVIDNSRELIIISSENYYYSTNSLNEASYLSAILNSPILSKYIKLIKSSRHIHKRPFLFSIPLFNKDDENHIKLAKKGLKYQSVVQDLVVNNKRITSEKVRTFIHQKLSKLNDLAKLVMFNPQ